MATVKAASVGRLGTKSIAAPVKLETAVA